MHLKFRNVNDAFYGLVDAIHHRKVPTVRTGSRNGDVIQITEPVIVTYAKPRERVLFNRARDANPFFHLYESLWMLAGRNDLAPIKFYVSTFDQFSDDGQTLNGAYGYRWRQSGVWNKPQINPQATQDQLQLLIEHLKAKPESRRAVLQMWNVEDDLLKIDSSKDVCCNLSVMFSLRTEPEGELHGNEFIAGGFWREDVAYLDMTVTNRSNDIILGMLGANVVHFSMLQEYMACCLGAKVGVYNQFTNNAHVYVNNWKPEEWLREWEAWRKWDSYPYLGPRLLEGDREQFDKECQEVVSNFYFMNPSLISCQNKFLEGVAEPMFRAYAAHKQRQYDNAMSYIADVEAEDWITAAATWLEKRRYSAKKGVV